jgi:tetratricopeptide (TPR) repeat protein
MRVKLFTPAFLAMAAVAFSAASVRAAMPQQSSQTPQPQQGDSSQPAPPSQGNPQDGPLPPPPAPDRPSAQQPPRPSNDDTPTWSSSKKPDSGPDDPDDSASDPKAKPKQKKNGPQYTDDTSDSSDSSDSATRPPSKAKPGVLAPESNSAWDPFHAAQDVDVGKFYMDKGDYDAAITRFEDAIRLQGNFAKPRALIAEAYEKKGDKEQAAHYYQEYLKVLPNAADAKKIQKKIAQLQSK